jgi:putative flippase GtrA
VLHRRVARLIPGRLIRFGVTGCAGFAVDLGTLVVFHSALSAPLAASTVVAYGSGGMAHYSLTRYWVFPQDSRAGELGRITRYLLLAAANMAATLVMVLGLTAMGADYRVAKVAAVVLLFFTNYALTPRLVMTSPGRRAIAPRDGARST